MYAKSPNTRPRFTILFTDGEPSAYYTPFENVPDFRSLDSDAAIELLRQNCSAKGIDLLALYGKGYSDEERPKLHQKYADLITPDLKTEVRKMRETHSKKTKQIMFLSFNLKMLKLLPSMWEGTPQKFA